MALTRTMALTKVIVVSGFATAFAAGLITGVTWQPSPVAPTTQQSRGDRGSWWAQQLALTTEQQAQMKQIWSEVSRGGSQDRNSKRTQNRRERDEAISKLIRPEDRAAYEALLADYTAKNDAADAAAKKEFDRAIERTREILTPEQRKKYDELMPRPGGPGQGWDRNRSTTRPSK